MRVGWHWGAALVLLGCYQGADSGEGPPGADGGSTSAADAGSAEETGEPDPPPPPPEYVPASGARRLSRAEYANTVRDVLGIDPTAQLELLAPDTDSPFDNDYTHQAPSTAVVEGLRLAAGELVEVLLADPAKRDAVVGCTPAGPADADCLREFTARVGRRLLRRPLDAAEVDLFVTMSSFNDQSGDFYTAVGMILRSLLQDVEFVYHIEIGEPTDDAGVLRLTQWEFASRLSFFLGGSAPDVELLDAAERGDLNDPEAVRTHAERLLLTDRGAERVDWFHALWLGYDSLPHSPELTAAMRAETRALLDRVVFDDRAPWLDVFTANETWVDSTLAEHYGLTTIPTEPSWVSYDGTGRAGILSHGTVLANGSKFGDTSPTQRGIYIRERLLCTPIPLPPPDAMVDVDEPPGADNPDACKYERYDAHRTGSCAGCHELMDPIGFGLENYDAAGRFRAHDVDRPECPIEGTGELTGIGTFNGPAELGQLLIEEGGLEGCAALQLLRFTLGREVKPDDADLVEDLTTQFQDNEGQFHELMLRIATAQSFRFRVPE